MNRRPMRGCLSIVRPSWYHSVVLPSLCHRVGTLIRIRGAICQGFGSNVRTLRRVLRGGVRTGWEVLEQKVLERWWEVLVVGGVRIVSLSELELR